MSLITEKGFKPSDFKILRGKYGYEILLKPINDKASKFMAKTFGQAREPNLIPKKYKPCYPFSGDLPF